MPIDFSTVRSINEVEGTWAPEVEARHGEASRFIQSFDWCRGIRDAYVGVSIAGVVATFLFRIVPATEEVDEWLWVIVGDIPPAYVVTDEAPNPGAALEGYIDEMRRWVEAVKSGQSTEDVIPVAAPPTIENAEALASRLTFLETKILPRYTELTIDEVSHRVKADPC